MTDHVRANEVDGRLAAIDHLDQSAMKKGILHIQLMEGEGEDGPNSSELDDGGEGLIVVYSRALSEASKDPTSLVAVERAIRGELVPEDPLVVNHVGAQWMRHQAPSVVGQQGHVFLFHGSTLVGIGESGTNGGADRRESRINVSRENQLVDKAENSGRAMRHHRVNRVRVKVDGNRVVHRWLGRERADEARGTDRSVRPRRW
jgi:hypothetical protein